MSKPAPQLLHTCEGAGEKGGQILGHILRKEPLGGRTERFAWTGTVRYKAVTGAAFAARYTNQTVRGPLHHHRHLLSLPTQRNPHVGPPRSTPAVICAEPFGDEVFLSAEKHEEEPFLFAWRDNERRHSLSSTDGCRCPGEVFGRGLSAKPDARLRTARSDGP